MRIGEVADATGTATTTLRYYEQRGLLRDPPRTTSGYRDYAAEDLDRVAFIRDAQAAGLTLEQIREVMAIRDRGEPPCHHLAEIVAERLDEVEQRIADLRRTRARLREVRNRLESLDPAGCDAGEVCSAIG